MPGVESGSDLAECQLRRRSSRRLQLATEALKRRPGLKVLYTSGYTENAIVHHGRLDAGVLLPKPYVSSELARMIRTALAS